MIIYQQLNKIRYIIKVNYEIIVVKLRTIQLLDKVK
jgi:hypothetical protein